MDSVQRTGLVKVFFWQSFLICLNGMNGVTKLYCSPKKKNNLSQEFNYMKCQAVNSFRSPIMVPSCLQKKNEMQRWNKDFSPKYNYKTFCKVLYKAIRNHSWKLARRKKYFVFNVWIFYFDISLVESFCLPFAKQRLLYHCQSGFEFSRWGLKMSTVILEKWLWLHGVMQLMPK